MTKRRQPPTFIVAILLTVFLQLSSLPTIQATSKDSLKLFQFVPKRGMFYVPYKKNSEELTRLLILIKQHKKDILTGNIPVFVNGFCKSTLNDKENLRLARERSNRIKTEMILRSGLREECFRTTNVSEPYGKQQNAVIVYIILPKDTIASDLQTTGKEILRPAPLDNSTGQANVQSKGQLDNAKVEVYDANAGLYDSQADLAERHSEQNENSSLPVSATTTSTRGWSIGLNLGIPFFWGDMLSMSTGNTHIGFGTGIQGSYHFSGLVSLTLSADYARGKTGPRDYASNYQLSPSGITLYAYETDTSLPYSALHSRISMLHIGLGLDINMNRLLGSRAIRNRFTVWLSPTVYGQFFNTDIYVNDDERKFSDGTTKPSTISLGIGGALSFRYRLTPSLGLQLRNSLIWITDNKFDGIVTIYGHTRQNAMWLPQIGIIWYPAASFQ